MIGQSATWLSGSPPELVAALWFAMAIIVMDRFDILLPRGDSMGVSGALVAAGLLVAGPAYLAPLAILSLVFAHVGRGPLHVERLVGAVITRLAAMSVAVALIWLWGVTPGNDVVSVLKLVMVSGAFLATEVIAAQAILSMLSGRPLKRLVVGNFQRQAPLIGAQVSAATLAAITYPQMESWSLVLVVALLLLIRQSLASLLEIRETYRATVEVLVEVAESQDERLRGHADRTAHIARSIGSRMGLSSSDIEKASYAALLHDLDALAGVPADDTRPNRGSSSDVFADTAFFDDVLPVLRLCDGQARESDVTDDNLMTAMIVALSSDIDTTGNTLAARAHSSSAVARVSAQVPGPLKARVVAAALELGYRTPAVS